MRAGLRAQEGPQVPPRNGGSLGTLRRDPAHSRNSRHRRWRWTEFVPRHAVSSRPTPNVASERRLEVLLFSPGLRFPASPCRQPPSDRPTKPSVWTDRMRAPERLKYRLQHLYRAATPGCGPALSRKLMCKVNLSEQACKIDSPPMRRFNFFELSTPPT